jgi:UDP-glucose 4-epimerase
MLKKFENYVMFCNKIVNPLGGDACIFDECGMFEKCVPELYNEVKDEIIKPVRNILKGSTLLVTGGTGSFGSALVDYLKDSEAHIIVYSRDETKQFDMRNERKGRDIEYIIGDIRDKDKLIRSFKGVDYVVHCFTPDTKILTNDGCKNIVDVKIGDSVITSTGNVNIVSSVMSRDIKEDIVSILPYMTNIATNVTKEHSILVWSPIKRCQYSYRSWCNPACNKKYDCKRLYSLVKPQMKRAGDLKVGDFVAYPRIKTIKSVMDIRFCKLLGYYVSQGSLGSRFGRGDKVNKLYGSVRFSINIKHEEDICEIEQLCYELYGKKPSRGKNGNCVNVTICGKDIAEQYKIGGIGAENKRIPESIMNEDSDHIKAFLVGYFNGDGCKNNAKMSTVSITLAHQLRMLFAKIGVCVGIHYYDRKLSVIKGRICKILPHYQLEISKLSNISELGLNTKKATNHSRHFIDDDYIYIQIRDIKVIQYSGYVYNISVENDETYVANFITSHNCSALKHVSTGELYPEEVLATNIIGTKNVLEAAEYCGVKRLVDLSTDKAVKPENTYGLSKAIAERFVLAHKGNTVNVCLRYGNVLGSRGSIIPIFKRLIANKEPLTITNPLASRFILSLQDAINLALKCLTDGNKGDLFIMKPPACTVDSIVKAFELYYGKTLPKVITGMKSGEKMHEILLTGGEIRRSVIEKEGDITYARIKAIDPKNYYNDNENYVEIPDYSSANAEQFTPIQVLNKLQEANLL